MENINTYSEEFHIDNDDLAEWALNKIQEADEDRKRLNGVSERKIEYYQGLIEDNNRHFENEVGFLKSKLYEYFTTVKHKETKTQESYKLPSGSLVWKKGKMDFEKDDDTLLEWVKKNRPDMVVTKESVAWGDYKKELEILDGKVIDTSTGEVVEGIFTKEKMGDFDVKL